MKAFTFQSLKDTIYLLQKEGYHTDLAAPCSSLYCPDHFEAISFDTFVLDKHIEVREADVSQENYLNLYAVSSPFYKLKGYLVSIKPLFFT